MVFDADEHATQQEKDIILGPDIDAANIVRRGIMLRLALNFRSVRYVSNENIVVNSYSQVDKIFAFLVRPHQTTRFEFTPSDFPTKHNYKAKLDKRHTHIAIVHSGETWEFINNFDEGAAVNVITLAPHHEENIEIPLVYPVVLFMKRGYTYHLIVILDNDIFSKENVHELFMVHDVNKREVRTGTTDIKTTTFSEGVHYTFITPLTGKEETTFDRIVDIIALRDFEPEEEPEHQDQEPQPQQEQQLQQIEQEPVIDQEPQLQQEHDLQQEQELEQVPQQQQWRELQQEPQLQQELQPQQEEEHLSSSSESSSSSPRSYTSSSLSDSTVSDIPSDHSSPGPER